MRLCNSTNQIPVSRVQNLVKGVKKCNMKPLGAQFTRETWIVCLIVLRSLIFLSEKFKLVTVKPEDIQGLDGSANTVTDNIEKSYFYI